ncbi:MAG: ABC-2 transporter permease [Lachnospiraceae bacterium]|nr:ABC-2 transporter permease [Lachnospiraceae bacterium]
MKNLLIKEFRLAASPLSYFFLAFSLMVFIPGYPILVGAFFICLGIFYSFQSGREQNDTIYTALRPLPKRAFVQAKFTFTCAIQCLAVLLMTVLTLVRMFALGHSQVYLDNKMMNANLYFLAAVLVLFALFNEIFLNGFFKTGYYFGKPFIIFTIAGFLWIALTEALHHFPGLEWLNTPAPDHMERQLAALCAGLLLWAVLTLHSLRTSEKHFDKIDL